MRLYDRSTIRKIKNRYGFKLSKSLGQNFLVDEEAVMNIVSGSGANKDDLVIEIGPGIGVLTDLLCERAGKVICIELDQGLVPVLEETLFMHGNYEIVNEDVLKVDLAALVAEKKGSLAGVKIIGNLPYYITTSIIMHLLESKVPAESITVMMQKEVAERIKADPGSRTYGAISCAVQYRCAVETVCEVGKECFEPVPKVDSEVLKLTLLDEPSAAPKDEEMFFSLIKAGFGQRRKTLLNSLGATGADRETIRECLAEAGIDEKRRAETLSLEEFARLSDSFVGRTT